MDTTSALKILYTLKFFFMKNLSLLFFIFTIHFCSGQTNTMSEQFLTSQTDIYNQEELTDYTQYFRLLSPLRKMASYTKAVELRAKQTHSTKVSRFQERNQTIGFYAFEYPNKKVCKLAVDTLLQCFPNFCIAVERGKPLTDQLTPSVYIINDKTVFCMETFCEDVNEQWQEMLKKFVTTFATNSSTIILTECGKLDWTSKDKLLK